MRFCKGSKIPDGRNVKHLNLTYSQVLYNAPDKKW